MLPLGSQAIPRTRQGYDGAPGLGQSELSYPHYDPARDPDLDIDLHPTNRLLYVGIGVLLIGIIVVLAISISDREEYPTPPRTSPVGSTTAPGPGESVTPDLLPETARPGVAAPGSPPPASQVAARPEALPGNPPVAAVAAGSPSVSADSISLHVVSSPAGADVLLAGKPIGVTPLDVKIKRATGVQTLTLHRARYQDATTTVDLSGDCSRQLALVPIAEEAVRTPSAGTGGRTSGRDRNPGGGRPRPSPPVAPAPPPAPPAPPPARTCQDPGEVNPWDKSCDGQPCPPCVIKK
jgi:hypothetical protein